MLEGRNDLIKGWTIPVATDIAFAVAAIAVVAKNVPSSLKIFLLTLAVVDDLGAVVLIAALYSGNIDYAALSWSLGVFVFLLALPQLGIRRAWVFVMGGLVMWAFMLQSGFHPTLAGVMTAITVPLKSNSDKFESPLEDLHDDFSAWVKYAIMPLFAITHAGFSFSGMGLETVFSPLVIAIVCGLCIGKPLGVLSLVYISKIIGVARIPNNINIRQLLGVGALCGIGFTMSLFLGGLSYADKGEIISNELKMGVFLGSIISGIVGIALLSKSNEK
jgi:NhaA family Na+:H+ antiporter